MRLFKLMASFCVLAPSVLIGTALSHAQDYPSRAITMIVPFPAGGPSDVVSRIMAEGMSRHLGQQVVIENVGGAGGTLGTGRAATSDANGYYILSAGMGSVVAAPALYPNLRYDPVKDFEPVGLTSHAPAAIVARKDFPAKNLKEFITYVRKNGNNVKQAHGGVGAASHMACLLFNTQLNLTPNSVAYRGTGPALNDLIGGHVDYFCEQVVSVAEAVKGGTIKAFGVSSDGPTPALPDVPVASKAGAPDYKLSIWSAILAPKGTPKPIVDKLAAALDKTLDDPAVAKRLETLGGIVPPKSERGSAYLGKLLKSDIERWDPILRKAAAESPKK
jgi:tripartite-type tricarboxylate transporter receptor subunit TctC